MKESQIIKDSFVALGKLIEERIKRGDTKDLVVLVAACRAARDGYDEMIKVFEEAAS